MYFRRDGIPRFINNIEILSAGATGVLFLCTGGPVPARRLCCRKARKAHEQKEGGPFGASRKSQQQTKEDGLAAHEQSIADSPGFCNTASRAHGALDRAKF